MLANVTMPGGWELIAIFMVLFTMLATLFLVVYAAVRLAIRPRSGPAKSEKA